MNTKKIIDKVKDLNNKYSSKPIHFNIFETIIQKHYLNICTGFRNIYKEEQENNKEYSEIYLIKGQTGVTNVGIVVNFKYIDKEKDIIYVKNIDLI